MKILKHYKQKNLSDYHWQEVIDIFNSVESTRKKKFVISKTNVKKLIPFLKKYRII